jgi:ferredoxin like protein
MTSKPGQKNGKGRSLEEKLFLVRRKKDRQSHIKINSKKCWNCSHKICLIICPAKAYEKNHRKIEFSYENCLECGTCRVACTEGAITWENPRGGFGISFVNG